MKRMKRAMFALLALCLAVSGQAQVFNVRDYGAKGDGNVKAFLKMPDGSHPANKLKIPWCPAKVMCFVESSGITVRGTVREPSIFDDRPERPFRNLRFADVKLTGEA